MQNGIDPRVGAWCNFLFIICTGVAAGAVQFGHLSGNVVDSIKTVATDMAFAISCANLVFHLYSSPAAGPMTKEN